MTKPLKDMFVSPHNDIVTQVVRLGELEINVVEKGALESSKNQDEFCKVEGGTTIITIKPEGTRVTKGELVCELDSAALQRQLDQPADHDQERRREFQERHADSRGCRDRRDRVRRGHLQARAGDGRG